MTGFTNAGFETGDFTGWSTTMESGGVYLCVQTSTKSEGSYAVNAICDGGYPIAQGFDLKQTIDLTSIDEITFDLNITQFTNGGENCYFRVIIDGDTATEYTDVTAGWATVTLDTSAYSGEVEVDFMARCPVPDW